MSRSYAAVVTEQLTLYFAGNPNKPGELEFELMVGEWTRVLQDAVPEYRLAEVFVYVRRNRATTFQVDVSEICSAWKEIKEAEKVLRPSSRPVWAKEVCFHCNGTGTRLIKKNDLDLGREYIYAVDCKH